MKNFCLGLINLLEKLRDLPPLFFRLILAYGFYGTATTKIKDFSAVVEWFGQLHIPYPLLSAILSVSAELAGVICLTLGLFTRLITLPLLFLLFVAIVTVHWVHGFAVAQNGFEIPLYYILMLFYLLVRGPGRISFDGLLKVRWLEKQP